LGAAASDVCLSPNRGAKPDIAGLRLRAITGREQTQHMLCDDLVGRARSSRCTIIPEETPTPSRVGIEITKRIVDDACGLGIEVHDHIIVGRDGHASLRGLKVI